MLLFQCILLFLAASLGGALVLGLPRQKPATFNLVLVFVGSYLFSITLLHLLPDLFSYQPLKHYMGLYILLGFFLQLLLGFFSKGIEHGHVEAGSLSERTIVPSGLFTSLCIHALLEGIIVSNAIMNPFQHTHIDKVHTLFIGIILHKISESFALVTVLIQLVSPQTTVIYLILFAMASPLGLVISKYCSQQLLWTQNGFVALSAIAAGNFLHIATTIFFENSTNHRLNARTLLAILSGATLAILFEYFL